VNRDYTLVEGMSCKGARPALLPVILDEAAKQRAKEARNRQPGGKMQSEIEDMKDNAKKDKQLAGEQPAAIEAEDEEDSKEPETQEPDFSKGPIAPKYEIVYTYPVSLGQFRNIENINEVKDKETPTEMKIRLQIPHAIELDKINCDFKDSKLVFEYENLYYLEVNLMYLVDSDNAEAKFVSSKKQLEVKVKILNKLHLDVVDHSAPADRTEDIEEVSEDPPQPTPEEDHAPSDEQTEAPHEAIEEVTADSSAAIEQPAPPSKQDKPIERLEASYMLVPQSTYLEDAHIHLLHLRGYQSAAVDVVEEGSTVLLRWTADAGNSYFYLTLDELPIGRLEKRFIRDYVSIVIPFSSADASSRAKAASKIVTDVSYEAIEDLYQKLVSLRLSREQPTVTEVQEAPVQPVSLPVETPLEAKQEEPLETEKEEEPPADSPSADRSVGYQLLSLRILEQACELD